MSLPLLICDITAFVILTAIVVYIFIFSQRLKKDNAKMPSNKFLNVLMAIMIIAIVLVVALIITNTIVAFLNFLK